MCSISTNKLIKLRIDNPVPCGKKHMARFPWAELSRVCFSSLLQQEISFKNIYFLLFLYTSHPTPPQAFP